MGCTNSKNGPICLPGDVFSTTLPPQTCVIAIDFGTSRTAFAYSFVGSGTSSCDICLGTPTDSILNNSTENKAQTILILDKNLKAIGFGLKGRMQLFSQNMEENCHMFKWFKMDLKDIKRDDDESFTVNDHNGKPFSLFVVITQALLYVAESALKEVNSTSMSRRTLQDIHWAVTIPAIWSPAAEGFMRRAAHKAGLIPNQLSQKLTLVREPEAACLDLLSSVAYKTHPAHIPVGSKLLAIDLGGGTHDMYFVEIISDSPLKCRELKCASGGSAGATKIDQCVLNMLKELFGDQRFKKFERLSDLLDLMESWEAFKMTFYGSGSYSLKLADLLDAYHRRNPDDVINADVITRLVTEYNSKKPLPERITNSGLRIDVPQAVLRRWFDSVVNVILADLDVQLRHPGCAGINILHLVGGFSSSKYLLDKVSSHITASHAARNIRILPASKPDVAIVRGAVHALLDGGTPFISDHLASKVYGIEVSKPFARDKHDGAAKTYEINGLRRVNVFHVYVAQGERIPLDYVTPEEVFYPMTAESNMVTVKLYTLEDASITRQSVVLTGQDSRLKLERTLTCPIDMSIPYDDRKVRVSIRFGMEIQLVVKDKDYNFYDRATSQSFV